MGIKFSSVVIVILGLFIIKVTVENFNQAQANSDKTVNYPQRPID